MKFECHHTINGTEDSFIIEGETIRDIKEEVKKYYAIRGIDITDPEIIKKYNLWSTKIED